MGFPGGQGPERSFDAALSPGLTKASIGPYCQGSRVLLGAIVVLLVMAASPSCRPIPASPELTVGVDGAVATLDPHLHNDAVAWSVLSNLYDGLAVFSREMRLQPALATSWRQVEPTRWRFQLRHGVLFSDGSTLTADDVVASYLRARDHPFSRVNYHLRGIAGMEAESVTSVLVTTLEPLPTLPNRLTMLFIVPQSHASLAEISEPVGTGPYRLMAGKAEGSTLALEGWDSWRGWPEIRRVRFEVDNSGGNLLGRFIRGDLDIIRNVPDAYLSDVRGYPELRTAQQPRLAVQMVSINPAAASGRAAAALSDLRVRRALLLATDRERWVQTVYRGQASPASQFVHPVVFGYDPNLSPARFDLPKARALVQDAGSGDGFEIELDHAPLGSEAIAALVEDWGRLGIVARPREWSWREFAERVRARRSAVAYFGWGCATGDASDFLNACAHSPDRDLGLGAENHSGFSDPVVDALIAAAEREMDPGTRLKLLHQAQQRVLELLPILPLTVRWGHLGVSSRVEAATRHDQWLWIYGFRWR